MKKSLLFVVILLITVVTSWAQAPFEGASNSVSSPCASITQFPYFEGFEVVWPAAVAPGNGTAPDCWLNINGKLTTGLWRRATTASYIRTGVGSAQQYTASATNPQSDYLITPVITLTGNERIRFYAKSNSAYVDHIKVGIYDIVQNGQDITSMSDTSLITTILPNTLVGWGQWTEFIIPLSNYVGNYRIAFIRDITGYYFDLDDVTIETIPTCPQPFSSTFVVSETSATINWVPGNVTQSNFYFYYKESTATNYDSVIVTGTSYTLLNLISGSTYNYYIKSDCGIEFSAPTPVKTFKTLCPAITALPSSDSFDSYGTGTTIYPTCWMRNSTNPGNPYVSSTNASPPGSLYYNVAYPYGYSIAIYPKIDATIPINTIKASLKFRATGLDDTLYVGVMTDPYDVSTFEQVGFITATIAATFQDKEFFFTNYTGTGQFIALKAAYAATSSTIYVDNVVLDLIPSCANPTALTSSNITHTQVNLGWLENGTATTWNIEYGPTGFTQGTGTLLTGVTTNPYLITGLTPQTTYQFYVQADCNGSLSPWSNPRSVTTACAPIVTLPYSEPFDTYGTGTSAFPTCWTKLGTSTSYPNISSTSFAGAGSLYLYNGASGNYNYAIFPAFDATIPVNTLQMTFKFRASGTDDTLYVGVMTNPSDINSYTVVSTYTVPVTATFYDITTYFGSYTGSGTNIAFKSSYGASTSTIYVDNVVVSAMPACPPPSNITFSNITGISLNLQWTENGTATAWNVEYGPTGFTPGTGTMLTGVTTNPLPISGLNAQTQYQFYIQADCGAGTTSTWTTPFTVTTACSEIVTVPWTDFFDTYGTGLTVFPPCWTRNTTVSDRPYVNSVAFAGAGSLYFYAGTVGTYNIAATPIFSTQIPINTLMASFKYRTFNLTDTLYVGVMTDPGIASTFETVAVLTNSATTIWEDEMVFFSPYTGTGRYVAFKIQHNGTADYAYIDNLTIQTAPTCIMPTQLFSSTPTSTSINLNWTELGTSTSWNIEYGPVGFIQGTGTLLSSVTTNPYNVTGLNPQTAYQFYIQSNCATETSAWSFPLTAMTGCGNIVQLPYYEYFDYYGTGTGTFPTCWTKITSNATYPYITSTNFSAPGALYLYCSGAGAYNYAVSPQIDITQPINSLRIEFKFRATGTDDTLYVGVMSTPTDTATFELVSQFVVPTISVFDDYSVNFNSYIGTGQYIAFKSSYGATSSTIYIDNFQLMPIPNCARPIDLGVSNVTDVSAELFWSEDGTATTWNVEYGPTGFIPGTGTTLSGLTDTTVLISGLTAQTTYQFYAYADCGAGNISLASNVFAFTTACSPLLTIPYVENFDTYGTSTTTFPTCWRKLSSYIATSYPYLSTTNFSAPASMYFYSGTAGNYNIVIAPTFDATIPITTLRATFKYRVSGADDTLYVGVISNTNDPNSFVTISKITSSTLSSWLDGEVFFSTYTGTGQNIAFRNSYGATSSTIWMDNVLIGLIPTCPKPTNLTATAVQTTSFNLGFTENGTATNWIIEYGPVGFLPGTGVGTIITGVTPSPYLVSGLTAQTTYQFYIKSDCGGGDISEWSNPITVATACPAITTIPYTENFDTYGSTAGTFPPCWFRPVLNTTTPYPSIVTAYSVSSPASLRFQSASAAVPTYAITPQLDLNINTLRITFKLKAESITSSGTMQVGVMSDPNNLSTFELVETITPTTTSFTTYEVLFTNTILTGIGKYIAFKHVTVSSVYYYWLDDVVVDLAPSCAKPTQLAATNITTTTANISWTPGYATDNAWWIYYKTSVATTYDSVYVTSNPYTLPGLAPATTYQLYIRTDCGTQLSEPSNPITFTTQCIAISTIPWNDSFDTYGTGTGVFPTCWTKNTTNATYPYISTTNNSAPGSLYFYMGTSGGYTMAVTPMFDATIPINTLKAEFKMRVSGLDDTMFVGVMTDPTNAATFQPVASIIPAAITTWHDMEVFFSSYVGTGQYIAFKAAYTTSTVTIYLDNVQILAIPNCPRPTQVSISNVMSNSLNLNWIETGTATQWQVQYGPVGFALGTGTMINTSSNPLNIGSLTPSTSYDFYVRSICGVGDTSIWSVKTVGVTACVPITTLPWTEGFESLTAATTLPNCWASTNLGTYTNSQIVDYTSYNRVAHTGTKAIYFRYGCNDRFFTPGFQLTAGVTYNFSYWYITDGETGWSTLQLGAYSGQTAGTLVQTINTITTPITTTYTQVNATFIPTTTDVYYFGVYCQSNSDPWYLTLDDFSLTGPTVTCPSPSNLTSNAITATSAQISWTAGGTETTWELDYKLASASTWTTVPVATNPTHLLNTLTPVSNYEVRVRAVCGASDLSAYSPIHTFTTTATPCEIPTNLQVTNITDQAALISWTPGGTETSWIVEYKLTSSSNWTTANTQNNPAYPIVALSCNSSYQVRVKAICGTNESAFTSIVSFTTLPCPTYTITATASTFGTITPSGAVSVNAGANQLFTFTPDNMYYVDAVVVDGVPIANPQPTYEFMNVQANHTIYVEFATWGIDENALAQLVELFPNPTTSIIELRLKSDDLHVTECKVFDMYGKLMRVIPIHAETTSIDVTDFASGVYFVRMDSERGTISKKFVKK